MGDKIDHGIHLETEEVVATIAVLVLAGVFIWQQLEGRKGEMPFPHSDTTVPVLTATLHQHNIRRPEAGVGQDSVEQSSGAVPRHHGIAAQSHQTSMPGCEQNGSLRPGSHGGSAVGECAVERPLESGLQGDTLSSSVVDEVILGSNAPVRKEVAAGANPQASVRNPVSSATLASVNFNQSEGVVKLVGQAPAEYGRVQVIVNGKRLEPVHLDAAANWQQEIPINDDQELYVQLVGVDSSGELIFDDKALPAVYVVSLQDEGGKQSGVNVMAGQLYHVNPEETVATLARDFGVDPFILRKVNGLAGRRLKVGEVLFIPFATSAE